MEFETGNGFFISDVHVSRVMIPLGNCAVQ